MRLTLDILKLFQSGTIFASGILPDSEEGINMTNSGRLLRWVAVKGSVDDWAIYCLPLGTTQEEVSSLGDKVCRSKAIRRCIQCDDETFLCYRL